MTSLWPPPTAQMLAQCIWACETETRGSNCSRWIRPVKEKASDPQCCIGSPPSQRNEDVARAQANVSGIENATVREESFDLTRASQPRYDLVSFIAVLHHLPLAPALQAARSLLRPGGRLVIVGLAQETSADLPWSLASVFLNAGIGAIRHPRRAHATPPNMMAPTAQPLETFEQIRETARAVLPGVKMRRALFWRYTVVWEAPPAR